jgi:CRISPR type III-B/RAMP module-associated protein Cmr5
MHKEANEDKYRSLCMKAPMLIKQSGLVQALAFFRSREDDVEARLFVDHLAAVYTAGGGQGAADGAALQRKAHGAATLGDYLALSRELVEISVWMRRFAQSELSGGKG